MNSYILAIDQGTTGSTALLIDEALTVVARSNVEFPQHFPRPGWVEHDLEEIWASVTKSVTEALRVSRILPSQIAAIGITNQRETTCLWDKDTGAPLTRAIVWQDRRTADFCARLKKKGLEPAIRKKTGLCLDPYFSGTKLSWLFENHPALLAKAKTGKVAFGTIESFLLFRLTGVHATEASNASRTLLMNLKTCAWEDDLLKIFKVPRAVLPEIYPAAVPYGHTRGFLNIPDGTPVTGLIGDQQAALFGQACFKKGMAKCTYGTGAFALVNTGPEIVHSKHQLLTTVGWQLEGKTTYCIEGSAFIAGAAVQWLRDGLGLFEKSADVERLAAGVEDSAGVVFVPALSGMGAPHWLPTATGFLTGLTRGTTKAHVARATLDGIAYQVTELMEAMEKDFGKKIQVLKADGGAAMNGLLMQFQADLLGTRVVRPATVETTALGAGLMAGLAIGYWKDLSDIEKRWSVDKEFLPRWKSKERTTHKAKWSRAIKALKLLS